MTRQSIIRAESYQGIVALRVRTATLQAVFRASLTGLYPFFMKKKII